MGHRTVDVKKKGSNGVFSIDFRLSKSGEYTVRASHDATAAQAKAVGKPRKLGTISPGRGGTGSRLLQRGLHRLGYVDSSLDRAVLARFGELVAAAAAPIDDVRGSAAYRRQSPHHPAAKAIDYAGTAIRDQ